MSRLLAGLPGLVLAAFLGAAPAGAAAADTPFAGTWKMVVLANGQELTLWLMQLAERQGIPSAKILSPGLPTFKDVKVKAVRLEDQALHLTFQASGTDLAVVVYLPQGEAKPGQLLGSVERRGQREFARLERTDRTALNAERPEEAVDLSPGREDLVRAMRAGSTLEKEAALRKFLAKHPDGPLAYYAGQELAGTLAARGAPEAEVRARADQAVAQAAAYGPDMERQAAYQLARRLLRADKMPALAVAYATRADKLLDKSVPAAEQVAILKTLAGALRKAGQAKAAEAVAARTAPTEESLDQEFARTAIPFQLDRAVPRPGKDGRVALLELFTGAQCPPCVAADIAFDALLETYEPAEVVLLQYHLHVPGPDPLANPDAEKRGRFYDLPGTPGVFLDGKEGPPLGGPLQLAKERYDALRAETAKELDNPPQARLQLTAQQAGDRIQIHAEVVDLKKTGEKVRLRLALVEEVARYPGRNGRRLHHHVVRTFAGGVEGLPLKAASARHDAGVNLGELRQALMNYLDTYAKQRPFPDDERPLEFKNLKVVAFVQDDETKEILQAAQADVARAR